MFIKFNIKFWFNLGIKNEVGQIYVETWFKVKLKWPSSFIVDVRMGGIWNYVIISQEIGEKTVKLIK